MLEQRSAEDRFDSTGYIFESRLGRCSLDPVLEQQRSKATSFDPSGAEELKIQIENGVRLRRATLGEHFIEGHSTAEREESYQLLREKGSFSPETESGLLAKSLRFPEDKDAM